MECMAKWYVTAGRCAGYCGGRSVGGRAPHIYSSPVNSITILTTRICLAEWQDERPPAPSYLRILYLGKILQDEDTLESKYLLL